MKKSQIVTKEKRVIFLSLVLFMPIMLYPANSYEAGDPLADYLEQKALSNCEKAMEIIEDWTLYLDDPLIIETNIFRINELIKYPELIENAINAYKNMLGNKAVQDNPVLKARVNIFLNMLYLRKGRVQEALSVKNGLGFIGRYMIAGPLRNSADFSKPFIPETDYCGDYPDKAKADNAKCFEALPDLTGRIDMNDLLGDISDPVFYLKAEVIVPDDGSYSLWLAKTGYTDIWMDGNRVFSNRKKHDFTFDQYRLEFSLSKGRHVLLIKAGGSRSGAMLALRFTDDKGNAISEDVKSETGIETKANAYSSLTGISLFNAMERILNKKPAEGEPAFYAAYLYYVSGLNSEEDKEAVKLFSKAKESGEFCSVSNYYLGLLEKDRAKKDIYFNESINASKKNAESLKEIADIKLQDNLLYEIYPIIDKLAEINPGSFLNNKLKAQAFMLAGWHSEALKEASLLKDNGVKSCGYEIESLAYIKDERYKEALNACKHLYEADRYNMKSLNDLIECCLKTGRYDYADSLLSQSAELYPNNVLLRLKHAGLIKNTKDARACLPYLLCAKKISPYHKEVLLNIGMVYHKLEKDELALEYLRAALQRDPKEDIRIKEYIRIITPPNPPEGAFCR